MKRKSSISISIILVIMMLLPTASFAFTAIPLKSITLKASTASINAGDSYMLQATVLPQNTSDKVLKWSSSNGNVAKVDQKGVVTAVAAGTAVITVSNTSGKITATCKVTVKNAPVVKIKWIVYGELLEDSKTVWAEFNKELSKKLPNTIVEISPIDGPSYNDKSRLIVSAGEDFDIMWSSGWKGDYSGKIAGGAFMPITELINKNAPKLWDFIPKADWDSAVINGVLYGVPSHQTVINGGSFNIPHQYYDKVTSGVDMAAIEKMSQDNKISYVDVLKKMEPVMANAKKYVTEYAATTSINTSYLALKNFMPVFSVSNGPQTYPLAVTVKSSNSGRVINYLDTKEFMDTILLARDWQKKGYLPKDVASFLQIPFSKIAATVAPGNYALPLKMNDLTEEKLLGTGNYTKKVLFNPPINCVAATSSSNFINKKSKNPERAIKVLEAINDPLDTKAFNLLAFGRKDKEYIINADGTVAVTSTKYKMRDWVIGNTDNSISNANNKELINANKKLMADAPTSIMSGFVFDMQPIRNEVASVTTVLVEYMDALQFGLYDDPTAKYNEMMVKLRKAGVNKIIDESQAQVTKFFKSKAK